MTYSNGAAQIRVGSELADLRFPHSPVLSTKLLGGDWQAPALSSDDAAAAALEATAAPPMHLPRKEGESSDSLRVAIAIALALTP